jgi:ribosome-binding factor A
MANPRTKARIEARIRERVAYCIEFELSDPRAAFVTVTRVEASSDLSAAKVFYSVLGSEGDRGKVQHMLEDATGFVRRAVGRVLRMRRLPSLTFAYDESIALQDEMERKIADALASDREINPAAHGDDADEAEEPR